MTSLVLHRSFVLVVALGSALAARAVGHFALRDLAHVMDEIAYLFQAKIFAAGHLTAPTLEPRAAFNMWFVEDRSARFGIFPPGWPALLAIAVSVGMERWLGPLLHLLTVILVGRAGERLGGPRLGSIAALGYATCPQSIILAAGIMSHGVAACSGATILLLAATLATSGAMSTTLMVASGLALGLTASTRPLCAIVLAVGLALALWRWRSPARALGRRLAIVALAGAPFMIGLLFFNRATTGSALRFPQAAYFDEHLAPANVAYFAYRPGCNDLGVGPSHGCDFSVPGARYTFGAALGNLGNNLLVWLKLIGLPLPVGVALALGRRDRRSTALVLLAFPVAAVSLYMLYWNGGTCYGARFYHAALPATWLVIALGIALPKPWLRGALLAGMLAWDGYAGFRAVRELSQPEWGYWGVDDRFRTLRRQWQHGPAVVMVAFGPEDLRNGELGYTAVIPTRGMWMLNIRAEGALAENSPFVDDGEVVFTKFHPALVPELEARFPTRSFWLYVSNGDPARDTLEPWQPSSFEPGSYRRPVDNFDGFRVAPALEPAPAILTGPPEDSEPY